MSDYKRLTDKKIDLDKLSEKAKSRISDTYLEYAKMNNALWELENKIENGTLIELPCKVGDVVYAFVFEIEPHIEQYSVIAIEIGIETFIRCFEAKRGLCYLRPTSIFLTKAEAEKKLEELKGVCK